MSLPLAISPTEMIKVAQYVRSYIAPKEEAAIEQVDAKTANQDEQLSIHI